MPPTQGREPGDMARGRFARIDVVAGLLLMAVAAAAWSQALRLDPGVMRNLGPGMVPRALAALLFACSAALFVAGLLQSGARAERLRLVLRGPLIVGLAIVTFAATLRGVELGALAIPQFGLAVAGPLTIVIAGHGGFEADRRELLTLGFGLTALCMLLFGDWLGMSLPTVPGLVEQALSRSLSPETTLRAVAALEAALAAAVWRFLPGVRPADGVERGDDV